MTELRAKTMRRAVNKAAREQALRWFNLSQEQHELEMRDSYLVNKPDLHRHEEKLRAASEFSRKKRTIASIASRRIFCCSELRPFLYSSVDNSTWPTKLENQ